MTRFRTAAGLGLLLLVAATAAHAQGFGKNKVQYDALDWAVLKTPHLRVHFYAEEESLARRITPFAESVAVEYSRRFRLEPRHPIPILLYSAHYLFQQTNAAEGLISEGTGGLTELIKGRVMIPHTGSWARLAWVTRHELTHAYMLEKISVVMKQGHRNQTYLPPLWFTEGLAEYFGTTWDEDAEGLLRDAVLTREALPLTESAPIEGTVLMYKEGQSFLLWLAERYGRDKVVDLLEQWPHADDFETAFRLTFGAPVEDLDREWFAGLKRRFYPLAAEHGEPGDVARPLLRHGEYILGPRALPGPSVDSLLSFCYFQASVAGIDLMLSEPRPHGGRRLRRVLHGGQSPVFESFHLFLNRPDVSPSGKIAVTAKHGGRDALILVDPKRDRILKRLEFPQLVVIHDPAWVPGDSAVVFSAQDYGGRADLYRVRWPGGRTLLERLTHDDYDDLEPSVSPDGRWVVFASDRAERGGHYSLFRLALAGGVPEAVSFPDRGDDHQPVYSPDGRWIVFRSTRAGISDLWVRRAEPDSSARRLTRLWGPVSDPSWLPDGSGVIFTAQHAIRFRPFALSFHADSLIAEPERAPAPEPLPALIADTSPTQSYDRKLGFDIVQNAVNFDPALGSAGAGQIALSDVLGNERVLVSIFNDSERFGKFWDGFEGGTTYVNQSRRLNWGFGFFRLTELYDAQLDVIRREQRIGTTAFAQYPLSKFTRVEASLLLRHVTDHQLRNGDIRTVDLVSNFIGWAHDDARWSEYGPSAGSRTYLTAGYTRDLGSGDADFATVLGEFRHYRQPLPAVVYAARFYGQSNVGPDAQPFFLGGPGSVHGTDRRSLGGLKAIQFQNELRFPLLRGLVLALPAPWEFPTVSGALFADGAEVWNIGTPQKVGSVGFSFWVGGGYYPALRWNYAWLTTDFITLAKQPRTQFTLEFNY